MRRLILAALTASAIALLAAVPGTSGAWTASLQNASAASTSAWFTCSAALTATNGSAFVSWPLADAVSSTVAVDSANTARNGSYRGARAVTTTGPGGCVGETGRAALLDGSTSWLTSPTITPTAAESSALTGTATMAAWVRTTPASTKGGDVVLICKASTAPACSSRDHRLYVAPDGRVVFGTANGAGKTQSISSAAAVNDGSWHHIAGTLSSAGMRLFVDGTDVTSTASVWFDGSPTSQSAAATYTSTRALPASFTIEVGTGDGATNWPLRPVGAGQTYFDGAIAEAGLWTAALSAYQVASFAAAGR